MKYSYLSYIFYNNKQYVMKHETFSKEPMARCGQADYCEISYLALISIFKIGATG